MLRLLFLSFILVSVSYCSCKKSKCDTAAIGSVQFMGRDSIPDTGAVISMYMKDNTFSSPVATSSARLWTISSRMRVVMFPDTDVYSFDWEIVLLPSHTTYRFSNVSHDNSSEKKELISIGEAENPCENTIHYRLNGVTIDLPVNRVDGNYSGSINVPIQVDYP